MDSRKMVTGKRPRGVLGSNGQDASTCTLLLGLFRHAHPRMCTQAARYLPLPRMALASLAATLPIAAAAARSRVPVLRRAMSSPSVSVASPARVGVVQMTSVGNLDANYATCSRLTKEAAAAGIKFLCFPEVFSFIGSKDGESVKLAEPLDGPVMQRYCSLANESSMWLSLGGFQEKGLDDSHQYNTHVIIDDSGKVRSSYRKIHLFDVDVPGNMVYKESRFTTAGDTVVAVDSPFGRLGLTVCYDLRFPELYQCLRFKHQAQCLKPRESSSL